MQNANSSQGQNPLCLYWLGTGNVLWAKESTHLDSICLYYVTSISSLSFSQPLFENPHRCFSHSLPPPVICVSLVIIIAYWKRCGWLWALLLVQKKSRKNRETSIFPFSYGRQRVQDCLGDFGRKTGLLLLLSPLIFLISVSFLAKKRAAGVDGCCCNDSIPSLKQLDIYSPSHTTYKITSCPLKCCEGNGGNGFQYVSESVPALLILSKCLLHILYMHVCVHVCSL